MHLTVGAAICRPPQTSSRRGGNLPPAQAQQGLYHVGGAYGGRLIASPTFLMFFHPCCRGGNLPPTVGTLRAQCCGKHRYHGTMWASSPTKKNALSQNPWGSIFRLGRLYLSGFHVLIHFGDRLVHVHGGQKNVRMSILKYHKNLMSKALSHPFQVLKIENHFLKIFQSMANTLCL